ncbi:MAG: UDP-phosphate galactose phosphotransferase [Lentisphaerae bacterium RIFOXYB12_FULL_65_16]|nr:MAG: UDP-phosphate galactose phosphotransferase [Lentisphaerae bacterium RIFOXYA12_64_32]OGV87106.1 MAG: UDP-phosphate galactose phosphotransferase [Lentisphaerae bacterium RIFOXYB12_FULL_65_16]
MIWVRLHFGGIFELSLYTNLWPCLLIFPIAYQTAGLYHGIAFYPGVAFGPAEEIRRTVYATSFVYFGLGVASFLSQSGGLFSRLIFLGAWAVSLVMVPLMREVVRMALARQPWWGAPAIICGAGPTGLLVIETLQKNTGLGLRAVAVVDDDPSKQGQALCGVPVVGPLAVGPEFARRHGIRYAIIAMPGVDAACLRGILETYEDRFRHLLLIPNLFGFSTLWVRAHDLGGILGLEVRQQLLMPGVRVVKRSIDLVGALVGGALILPLILVLCLLIKVSSRGPVFYGAQRLGRRGRLFTAWKFRTMVQDADRVLSTYLERHPELRAEWERTFKLKNDPRVTLVGRFLRKTSLDELPQLWNVVTGEMSLVGPRPIVEDEIGYYGENYEVLKKVRPGITGLWQVSGRSDTSYERRVSLDLYYVRNWSVWLDVYILARTVKTVLACKGAY